MPGTTPHNFLQLKPYICCTLAYDKHRTWARFWLAYSKNPSFRPPPSPKLRVFKFSSDFFKIVDFPSKILNFQANPFDISFEKHQISDRTPLSNMRKGWRCAKKKLFYIVYMLVTQSLRIFSTRFSLKSDFEKS